MGESIITSIDCSRGKYLLISCTHNVLERLIEDLKELNDESKREIDAALKGKKWDSEGF